MATIAPVLKMTDGWRSRLEITGRFEVQPLDIVALAILAMLGFGLSILDSGAASILVLGLAFACAVFRPAASVAAITAAIPFVARPVDVGNGEFSFLELAILIAAMAVGLRLLVEFIRQRSLQPIMPLLTPIPITMVAVLLVAVGIASIFTVADPRYRPDSVRELRWVIVEPVIALGVFRWSMTKRSTRSLIVMSLCGSACAIAIYGVAQLLTQTGVVVADGVERATGPYRHPNNLALYLDRVAIFALALAVLSRAQRRLFIGLALITGLGLAATLSRGALLAYVAGACWVVAVARVRHGWRWVLGGGVIAVVLIGLVGFQRLTDTGGEGSASSRELIWRASVQMIKDHPLTGVGLDQFLNQYNRRYVLPAGWPERYTSHPHNIVLDVWLRLGVAGLAVFALLIAAAFLVARRAPSDATRRACWAGAIGALIAGLVHGVVDNSFFLPDLAVLTWLMIAVLEASARAEVQGGVLNG